MLTGDLVRATVKRGTVEPRFVDPDDPALLALARALGELFVGHVGLARGELRAALKAHESGEGDAGRVRLERGLAKLLEDRSSFERATTLDPEVVRGLVFERAASERAAGTFERGRVLAAVAVELGTRRTAETVGAADVVERPTAAIVERPTAAIVERPTAAVVERPTAAIVERPTAAVVERRTADVVERPTADGADAEEGATTEDAAGVAAAELAREVTADDVERALEADRKVHERLLGVDAVDARALLVRYNVALVQAILLRATAVRLTLEVRPARVRHLLRVLKFRQLLFRARQLEPGLGKDPAKRLAIEIDGPLSLFGPSTKYGLSLAEVLPAVLLCERFELEADLAWGKGRVKKALRLTDADTGGGRWLRSPLADPGAAPPPELEALARRIEQLAPGWKATTNVPILTVGSGPAQQALVPDLEIARAKSGRVGWLEVIASARKESLPERLRLLAREGPLGLVVAVAKKLVDEADVPPSILVYRSMPDAREVLDRLESLRPPRRGRVNPARRI